MRAIVFGATGMVGQGVLRECLIDPAVDKVLAVGRGPSGKQDPKLQDLVLKDLCDYSAVEEQLKGYDACFFALGVTSAGLDEAQYTKITYDIAAAAGAVLARLNPGMTFVFVSGRGADSTGTSKTMWARVKGKAENAIFALPFKASYAVRPAMIESRHGATSRTRSYRVLYFFLRPLVPVLRALFPASVTNTEHLGKVMIKLARDGYPKKILESADINEVH